MKAPRRMGGRLRIENQVSTWFGQFERIAYAAEAAIAPLTANLGFRPRLDAGLVTQEGRGAALDTTPRTSSRSIVDSFEPSG